MTDGQAPLVVGDAVTRLGRDAAGAVLIAATYAGLYPAYVAALSQVRAAILIDAGGGKDGAGLAGLDWLASREVPAAAVDVMTARLGHGAHMYAHGVLSAVNQDAAALGLAPGMACAAAADILCAAPLPPDMPPPPRMVEDRYRLTARNDVVVWGLDSAALAGPADVGQILVTGSHGGLIGGDPGTALKVDAAAVFFNDAGIGASQAGVGRLPPLDVRGIPAATVDYRSARIGDARSTYHDGVISFINALARRAGVQPGMRCVDAVEKLLTAQGGWGR